MDPTQVRIADLSQTVQDPLLAKVRALLRREHGFPRDTTKKFKIPAVFSTEHLRYPEKNSSCDTEHAPSGLSCAGFGSSVCVTSVFGMAAAAMSLIQSAKLNGHDPYAYLKDVLERLPTHPASRIDELLPQRWTAPVAAA